MRYNDMNIYRFDCSYLRLNDDLYRKRFRDRKRLNFIKRFIFTISGGENVKGIITDDSKAQRGNKAAWSGCDASHVSSR